MQPPREKTSRRGSYAQAAAHERSRMKAPGIARDNDSSELSSDDVLHDEVAGSGVDISGISSIS